jgi:hypothetical protein
MPETSRPPPRHLHFGRGHCRSSPQPELLRVVRSAHGFWRNSARKEHAVLGGGVCRHSLLGDRQCLPLLGDAFPKRTARRETGNHIGQHRCAHNRLGISHCTGPLPAVTPAQVPWALPSKANRLNGKAPTIDRIPPAFLKSRGDSKALRRRLARSSRFRKAVASESRNQS